MATENPSDTLNPHNYRVGWICPLGIERAAALSVFDEVYERLPQHPKDNNSYQFGRIGCHKVVLVCLPSGKPGLTAAATAATNAQRTFQNLEFILVVGIGGGAPSQKNDIRLGDVVVSKPESIYGGVVQYDSYKFTSDNSLERTNCLNNPHPQLLNTVSSLEAEFYLNRQNITNIISSVQNKHPNKFPYPGRDKDQLFRSSYKHQGSNHACTNCDPAKLANRDPRHEDGPKVHYGTIGTAHVVMKDSVRRDKLAQEFGIMCFEMEAGGIMDSIPSLVIRGISDYADSHKNKLWQSYASLAAAAYAKTLLYEVPSMSSNLTVKANPKIPLDSRIAVRDFVGRESELEKLRKLLLETRNPAGRRVVELHGLGGIGKTQLAMRFANDHKTSFSNIIWLDGESRSSLNQSLAEKAQYIWEESTPVIRPELEGEETDIQLQWRREREKDMAQRVLRWLEEEGNSNWLLVLDNVNQHSTLNPTDEGAYNLKELFGRITHGNIIIITRSHWLDIGDRIEVGKLDPISSTAMLGKCISSSARESDIRQLNSFLDGHPLAISVARSYMSLTSLDISDFLKLNEESPDRFHERDPPCPYTNGCISKLFATSFREIQRKHGRSAKFLLLLSYFNFQENSNGQEKLFEFLQRGAASGDTPEWFREIASSLEQFVATIEPLTHSSLISGKGSRYSMHPIVRDWCQNYLRRNRDDELQSLAFIWMGSAIPEFTTHDFGGRQASLIPHALRMLELLKKSGEFSHDTRVLSALQKLGKFFYDRGESENAKFILERVFKQQKDHPCSGDNSSIETLDFLALASKTLAGKDNTKLHDVQEMLKQVLQGYQETYGPDHELTITARYNLALVCSGQDNAERIYKDALNDYERVLGETHRRTLPVVHALGVHYKDQGRFKDAEDMYRQALKRCEKEREIDNSLYLETMNNLGKLLLDQDRLVEAEGLFRAARERRAKVFGPYSASTLDSSYCLAITLKRQRKMEDAAEIYCEILQHYHQTLGKNHPETLETTRILGRTYARANGKFKQARQMLETAQEGYFKVYGETHRHTLGTIIDLGDLYGDYGKLEEAARMYNKVIFLDSKSECALDAKTGLALLHLRQGNRKDAKGCFLDAFEGYKEKYGPDNERTQYTADWLRYASKPIVLQNLRVQLTGKHSKSIRKYLPPMENPSERSGMGDDNSTGQSISTISTLSLPMGTWIHSTQRTPTSSTEHLIQNPECGKNEKDISIREYRTKKHSNMGMNKIRSVASFFRRLGGK